MSSKKTHFIHVRISQEEEEVINRKADHLGMRISDYIRFISTEAEVEIKKINVARK